MKRRKSYSNAWFPILTTSLMILIGGIFLPHLSFGDNVWKFAVIAPMSGSAASWGIAPDRGTRLAAEDINKKGGINVGGQHYKVEIITYDNKYNPSETTSAVNKAIFSDQAKYMMIVGTVNVLTAQPITEPNKILMLAYAGGMKKVTNESKPLTFRVMNCDNIGPLLYYPEFIEKLMIKKIAFLGPDDETGYSIVGEAINVIKKKKYPLEIVAEEYYKRGGTDFTPIILRVLAKKPDMVELGSGAPGDIGSVIKQLREMGYQGMTCQTTSAVTESVVWQIAGKGSIGHLSIRAFGEPPTKRFKDFYERYEKKFNEPCSNIVIESYDVLLGLGDAIEKAKTLDPVTVANVWGKMKFETSYGPTKWVGTQDIFGFGVDRSIMYAFPMSRIGSNGKLETWMSKNWTE